MKHTGQEVSSQDLDEASYAKAVIKETFRMSPISVGIGRTLGKDAVLSGYHVPAGVSLNKCNVRLEIRISTKSGCLGKPDFRFQIGILNGYPTFSFRF